MTKVNSIEKEVNPGEFVISLDFELFWGMHDLLSVEDYGVNIYGAHLAVPEILKLFKQYEIEATWAVVGMMNFKNMAELKANIPKQQPKYHKKELSPYELIKLRQFDEEESKLLFAPKLIRLIESASGQEISSHTFSHYYTLEKGQTLQTFKADTKAYMEVMNTMNNQIETIVFPRNQVNHTYLATCTDLGIRAYRGNEQGWVYQIKENDRKHYLKRGLRLLDMYVNVFGYQSYSHPVISNGLPLNIKGSRQLKPVSNTLKWLEPRRLKRILNSMTNAARKREVYHLWWHPHNFGVQLEENLEFLKEILEHYHYLKRQYNFQSKNMKRIAHEQMDHSVIEKINCEELENDYSMEKVYFYD